MGRKKRTGSTKQKHPEADASDIDDSLASLDEDDTRTASGRTHETVEAELEDDEREIRRLEKLLGLNKRKKPKKANANKKKLPKCFADMGLDYLLEPLMNSDFLNGEKYEEAEKASNSNTCAAPNLVKTASHKHSLYTEEAESGSGSDDCDSNAEKEEEVPKISKSKPTPTDDTQRLTRRAMALMNRLSEPTVPTLFKEVRQLYTSAAYSRAAISNALCNAAMSACVTQPNFVIPCKVSSPVAIFFALLRSTGCATDAVGQLIHRLCWILVEYQNSSVALSADMRESPKLENAVQLLSHLMLYRCLDSVLLLDVLRMFGALIKQCEADATDFDSEQAEFAANLTICLLRSAGPALRKHDPSGLADAMRKVQDAASNARSRSVVSAGSRLSFLAEVITAVRNNNFGKVPGYDSEESARFSKLYTRLKFELSARESVNDSPFRVSLSAVADYGESGKNWWLKADTCSGPLAIKRSEEEERTGAKRLFSSSDGKAESNGKYSEMAQKLHLNTELRRSIFSILVSSSDIEEATERLIKMPVRSESQRTEIFPVAFECCIRERNYNKFYAQLLVRLCSQETDRKQRLFRLALKKSFTERLAASSVRSPTVLRNTAKLTADLVRLNAISLVTALRCVDFTSAAPGTPTYAFLHALLDTFFHPSTLDDASFKRVVAEPLVAAKSKSAAGRRLSSSLLLFAKHMYDSGKSVVVDDDEGGKRRKVEGFGKYALDELRPRLDVLSAEML